MPAIQAVGSSEATLALSNSGSVSANVTLTARSYDGTIIRGQRTNPVTISIPALNSKTYRPKEVFGENLPPAWVEIQTASSTITGSFILADSSLPSMEGSALIESGASRIIFPKVTSDTSSNNLVLVNTSARKIGNIDISLFDNGGRFVLQRHMSLAGYAGFSGRITDLISDLSDFDGYAVVEVSSDQDALIGFETYRSLSDLAALTAIPDTDRFGTGHVTHFASQGGYVSTLVLVNYGSESQTISVTAGALEFNGRAAFTASQTEELTLGPNQRLETRLDELFGFSGNEMITGYVRYQTQDDRASLYGYMELKTSGGRMTAVPVQGDGYSSSAFSYIVDGSGFYTALALLNPGMSNTNVRIDAFDLRGYSLGTATVSLGPNGHWSRMLRELLPQTANQNGGSVRISASSIVLAVQLLGSTSSSGTLAVIAAQRNVLEPQQGATPVSARNGGVVTSGDGTTSLSIPAGALNADSAIRVTSLNVDDFPKPSETNRLIGIVQGKPAGTHFKNPVHLRFPLTEPVSPGTKLDVTIFNPDTRQYDETEFVATVDGSGKNASADVTHFTVFAVANRVSLQIFAINPSSGLVGSPVTITGSGFPSTGNGNKVRFTGQSGQSVLAQVLTAAADTLTVVVPSGAISGKVSVQVGNQKSNGVNFNVTTATNQVKPPANLAPVVSAGPDKTITLPASASFFGTVSDDGLPNGVVNTAWAKVSGPGTVAFGSASSPVTNAAFSSAGTYMLRLTANDGALSANDDVIVVVNAAAPTNTAPHVNAGSNQAVTVPSGAYLSGTASDDGLPTGSTLAVTWTKVSGPGTVVFANPSAATTSTTFSSAVGTYTLRLTATDGALSSTSDVNIDVNAAVVANTAPHVSAGSSQTITLPASTSLSGTASDDGLPTASSIALTWTKVGGPGAVTFGSPSLSSTSASFSSAGTYALRLTATDGALTSTADVVVTVNASPALNMAPVVNAGSSQTIVLPSLATVDGTATDDGLPVAGSLAVSWDKLSGPGSVAFGNAMALSTTVSFSTEGTYVLQLTASDGAVSSSSTVTIIVSAAVVVAAVPPPPPPAAGKIYYIDYVGGSDSNNGLTKSSPWKRAPFMHGTVDNVGPGTIGIQNGTCHVASCNLSGYAFIFKGGVTWPYSVFTSDSVKIGWGIYGHGTAGVGNQLYIGVDSSWFAGSSWNRPIFDAGGPSGNACQGLMTTLGAYTIVDNIEFTGLYFEESCASASVSGNAWYISPWINGHEEIKNNYFHGWSHAAYPLATDRCGLIAGTTQGIDPTSTAHDNVFDGSDVDNSAGVSCSAFSGGPAILYNNYMKSISNGATVNFPISFYQNTCDGLLETFEPTGHTQCFESNGDNGVLVYNNLNIHNRTGLGFNIAPVVGATAYFFNNVLWDVNDNANEVDCGTPAGPQQGGACIVYNNTIQAGNDASMRIPILMCSPYNTHCTWKNNHIISSLATPLVCFYTNCTESNNIYQTLSVAAANGYASSYTQGSVLPFMPTSAVGATNGTGANLTSLCGTIPALCTTTSAGVGYNRTNHTVIAPNSTAISRPSIGRWGSGAYRNPQ